ncbi:MAG: selenium cofactor biosynthesis protein YqeC [Anaerolineae bacterium]
MALTLARALRFDGPRTAAFVGAGGKTTAMFQLARELPAPVLITTTTHLGAWQVALADQHVIFASPPDLSSLALRGVTVITGRLTSEDRLGAVGNDALLWLHDTTLRQHVPLLIEADGSRQKPLKAPASHEPEIPEWVDTVIVVAGLSGLGNSLSEATVHRPGRFAALSGLALGETITPDALARVLMHPEGGLKNIPSQARRVALLNQADTSQLQSQAHGMADQLLRTYDAVLVASMQDKLVHAVHESVAGIVLAAGGSTRLGRPKQLLDWHGEPFVRAVARTALAAGLDPVVIVTGSGAEDVQAAVDGLPVHAIHNAEWQSGQASSIRTGLQSLPASTGAAIFLLADQPQVSFDVLNALVDRHAAGLSPIIAPLVMEERRANPVLFDRQTFPDLMALEGDVGGRAVFSKYRVEYLPWHDDRLLLDVDTEADYKRLVEDDTL